MPSEAVLGGGALCGGGVVWGREGGLTGIGPSEGDPDSSVAPLAVGESHWRARKRTPHPAPHPSLRLPQPPEL